MQGLPGVLARTRSRAFAPIEEALLLRELIAGGLLSQHEIARRCGRDVSWVSRRLQLVTVLSDAVLTAVRQGKVSTWAAVRIPGPLARANSAHAEQLLESLRTTPLTTRQLATWFAHYQSASRTVRERMVEAPQLLLAALTAKADEKSAERLHEGPEGEVLADIRILNAVSARLTRRLFTLALSPTELPPAVTAAVGALQLALASLQCHPRKLCPDLISAVLRPTGARPRGACRWWRRHG